VARQPRPVGAQAGAPAGVRQLTAALPTPGRRACHNPHNGGTAAAYAHAAALATQQGCDWLLLLDQDTDIPGNYLASASAVACGATGVAPVALVPQVCHGQRLVSPACLTSWGSVRPLPAGSALPAQACVTAIASGALLRTASLQAALPLPAALWLDYVDHWIFMTLHAQGGRLARINETLRHDLSIDHPETLSEARLLSILASEALVHRQLGLAARCMHPVRLLGRAWRYLQTNPRLAQTTLRWLALPASRRPSR